MTSSMLRAKAKVGRTFVHDVESSVDTFDFGAAVDRGFGAEYDVAFNAAYKFFKDIASRIASLKGRGLIQADPWEDGDPTTLQSVASLYASHHRSTRFTYIESVLEVTANSLFERNHPHGRLPDVLTYRLTFRLASDTVFAHVVAVTPSLPSAKSSLETDYLLNYRDWSLVDANGVEVKTIPMAALDRARPTERKMVLFFDPPLRPGAGLAEPFTLMFSDSTDSVMAKLEIDSKDELGVDFVHAVGSVTLGKLVLHLPLDSSIGFRTSPRPNASPARNMNAAELVPFQRPGYRSIGWIATEIPSDKLLVAEVYR
jgi:hypothetical protein